MDEVERETHEHRGHTITVVWYRDYDLGPPWKEHDGHGIVSEWTTRDKRPGERVLVSDRSSHRFYDFEETVKIAKRDKWGFLPSKLQTGRDEPGNPDNLAGWARCGDYYAHHPENFNRAIESVFAQHRASMTLKQYVAGAVEKDFEWMKRWCEDDWFWVGRTVSISDMDYDEGSSLWGIDSDAIEEYTKEAIDEAVRYIDNELSESHDAACRDIATVS